MGSYYLKTLSVGCPKNMVESSTYREIMNRAGYDETEQLDQADVVVYNTCGCLQSLQDRAKESAYSTSLKEHEQVIIAGCYPFIDKANTLKEDGYEIVPPGDYKAFKSLLGADQVELDESNSINQKDFLEQPSFVSQPSRVYSILKWFRKMTGLYSPKVFNFFKSIMMTDSFHYVTVGSGCLGNCTFCGIKNAIGNPKSRTLGEIIHNLEKGLQANYKDVWLVSDDVGSWGHDLGARSATLIDHVLNREDEFNLVINYFEPEMLLNQKNLLEKILSDPRIIQICIPIQTGSQKLLKRMGRHYDINEVHKVIRDLRKKNPKLIIKTQYVIGFPGETWSDFFKTLLSFRYYDGAGVNAYARLKFTPAYKLKPLSPVVVKLRTTIAKVFSFLLFFKLVPRLIFDLRRDRSL